MAYEANMKDRTVSVYANAAVTKGRFGKFQIANSRREVSMVDTAGATAHCVILEDGVAGGRVQVALPGQEVDVEAGAAIATAFGDCAVDATGRAITHPTTIGHYVAGQAQATAAAAGAYVPFYFGTPYPHP